MTREGVALAFEDVGKGAPPILLIHDVGSEHTTMWAQLEYLRGRHRVVAVDLRGHGESGGHAQSCSPGEFADDLAWLCYELGVYRPVAVGRGAGGSIAAELAARWPDLVTGVVTVDRDEADARVNAAIAAFLAALPA